MTTTTARPPGTSSRWLVGFGVAWALLAVFGRLLVVGEAALVWPALGLSITWFLVRRARLLSLDTVVLAAAAFATIALVGAPVGVACLGALTNALQAPLAVALIRRWLPGFDAAEGVTGLDSPRAMIWFSAAVLLPATAASAVALAGLSVLGEPVTAVLGLLLVGRNLCGGLLAGTLSLVLVAPLLSHRRPRLPCWRAVIEVVAAVGVGLALLLLDSVLVAAPVGFLVLAVAVWVGARVSVTSAVVFVSALGASVVVATLAGDGTFSSSSSQAASLMSQLFVTTIFCTCLALATARVETARLQAALHAAAAEAAYRAEFLDLTMATVHEGIMVVDAERAVTFVNPEAVRLLGVQEHAGTLYFPPLTSFSVDGEQVSEIERPLARALRGEDVQDVEAWVAVDPPQVLSISARQLSSTDSHLRRVVLTVRDVTSEHVQATALRTFAGVVAHDLQTPLAAINGWSELLADHLLRTHPDDLEAREHLARVISSSARMSSLIAELLAYATVKDRTLDPQRVNLVDVVSQIAQERGRAEQVVCGPVPPLRADATLIYQLFDNLIGNAVKFVAPHVTPHVVIEAIGQRGGTGLEVIEIHDNGVGIPAGLHDEVFSEFRRIPGSVHSGHGLGLAICQQIVTRHGGSISAHERVGATGTTFRVSLPADVTPPEVGAPTQSQLSVATDPADRNSVDAVAEDTVPAASQVHHAARAPAPTGASADAQVGLVSS